MRCPSCNSENVVCVDSRQWNEGKTRRRRACADCGGRFSTVEIYLKEYDNLLYRMGKMKKIAKAMLDVAAENEDKAKG